MKETESAQSLFTSEQHALLEAAKDKLRMATIERKRMSSINAESRGHGARNSYKLRNSQLQKQQ